MKIIPLKTIDQIKTGIKLLVKHKIQFNERIEYLEVIKVEKNGKEHNVYLDTFSLAYFIFESYIIDSSVIQEAFIIEP